MDCPKCNWKTPLKGKGASLALGHHLANFHKMKDKAERKAIMHPVVGRAKALETPIAEVIAKNGHPYTERDAHHALNIMQITMPNTDDLEVGDLIKMMDLMDYVHHNLK